LHKSRLTCRFFGSKTASVKARVPAPVKLHVASAKTPLNACFCMLVLNLTFSIVVRYSNDFASFKAALKCKTQPLFQKSLMLL
jgi:hypothetical protein